MSSKAFVFLGFLIISSAVAATDFAQTSTDKKTGSTAKTNGVDDAKYDGYDRGYPAQDGYGGYPGPGGGGYGGYPGPGGGGYGGYPGPGGGGYGGYPGDGGSGNNCRYGCCAPLGYGNDCTKCCGYAGEVADAEQQVKPHN